MTDPVVYAPPRDVDFASLEETLLDAFLTLRDALIRGRPAVVVVRDADLLGHGDPAAAALAAALVGLVRSLGIEGAREGWTVNALAVADDPPADALQEWVRRLGDGQGLNGGLVRLGELHLGRVPA